MFTEESKAKKLEILLQLLSHNDRCSVSSQNHCSKWHVGAPLQTQNQTPVYGVLPQRFTYEKWKAEHRLRLENVRQWCHPHWFPGTSYKVQSRAIYCSTQLTRIQRNKETVLLQHGNTRPLWMQLKGWIFIYCTFYTVQTWHYGGISFHSTYVVCPHNIICKQKCK